MLRSLIACSVLVPVLASAPARQGAAHIPTTETRPVAASNWKIDVSHSELSFKVRHIVSTVRGQFDQWEGTVVADPADWSTAQIDVTLNTTSINTNNANRDKHLKSADFFDAEKFPAITFKSTKVERKGDDFIVQGNLTMRGVTKPVTLTGKYTGETKGRNGKRQLGFDASTTVKRTDYGVSWNRAAEGGGMVLSDDVKIEMSIAAAEQ